MTTVQSAVRASAGTGPVAELGARHTARAVRLWNSDRVEPVRKAALLGAALFLVAALFLPLWGLTLWSIQFPNGLRMIVYATKVSGNVADLNTLNHYIGMLPISNEFFTELRVLPVVFGGTALVCGAAAITRRRGVSAIPLLLLSATAVYGFLSMHRRLYQFGHELDPKAAITIDPFTPPVFGEYHIAQFTTYSYFGWGTTLSVAAGVLVALALFLELKRRR